MGQSAAAVPGSVPEKSTARREYRLEDCLDSALRNNHRRPASRFAIALAEAQHCQALSGYWPQIHARGGYQRMDQSPNFLFPADRVSVPAQSMSVPGGVAMVTIPPGVFGNPEPIQLPVTYPGQTIDVPAQEYVIPPQDVKLMDPDSFTAAVSATWLVYDGGMRRGIRQQSEAWLAIARQEARRTDLEIIDATRRYYYGAVLARQLHQLGQDTVARLETTLNLTEAMYKEGSGRITRTDYLDNKVMVETLRSFVALLEKNEAMSQAALANTMGLPWQESVLPADREIPFHPAQLDLNALVATAYEFNPDWAKVEAGLDAAEGALRTARSGHFPKVALTGEIHRWWNDYDAGIATDRNKEGWTAGVGVEIPLFSGFLTRGKIAEARAQLEKIRHEQILLQEGLALQIKDLFLGLHAAEKAFQSTQEAMTSAGENRDLITRAYQNQVVDTDEVIRAQLVEALMCARHYRVRYEHIALKSQLNLMIGTQVLKGLGLQRDLGPVAATK